jgi:hypothetical protein
MIAFAMIVNRVEQLLSVFTGGWCSGDNENKKKKEAALSTGREERLQGCCCLAS